jgi:hypothetical protein
MSYGSTPAPSRALNNEAACILFDCLRLEFVVRLTGLQSAVHLNDKEGVIRVQDPIRYGRWNLRLDNGTYVSAQAVNSAHICRGNYKRRLPCFERCLRCWPLAQFVCFYRS